MSSTHVPADVIEAAVVVCGTAFYYHTRLSTVLVTSGVPIDMIKLHSPEGSSKYVVARNVFNDLASRGDHGQAILRRVIAELANLSKPDPEAADQVRGAEALKELRGVATRRRMLTDVDTAERDARQKEASARRRLTETRSQTLRDLAKTLLELTRSTDTPQARGYRLERLIADLFTAFELRYRPSYKPDREQIDGAFEYKGFPYLVEARWRSRPPDYGDLADFKGKVDGKLDSTRRVFISMGGYDDGVVTHFMTASRGTRNNLILVDGQDLSLVLEGNIGLLDALDYKIDKASQEAVWWAPLAKRS